MSNLPIVKVQFNPAAFDPIKARALTELEGVQGMVLADDDEAKLAAAVLVTIAGVKKESEKRSKECLAELKAEEKAIRAPFKAIEDLCDAARAIVDKALGAYELGKALAQRKALAEATKAVVADDSPGLTMALQTVSTSAPTKLVGVTVRALWVAIVRAPDLVPHAYLTPDLKKIGAHASSFTPEQTPTPIPGVVFNLETSTIARQPR